MDIGGTRHKLCLTAMVTNEGKTRWMIIDEAFDVAKLMRVMGYFQNRRVRYAA